MHNVSLHSLASQPLLGQRDRAARQALLAPSLAALLIATLVILLGPWSTEHRVVLFGCALAAAGFVVLELSIPWERFSALAYLPLPALGLLVIGAGMWASGGWSSPFTPFLMLPTAYAIAVTNVPYALPVAVLAGLVTASPGLYTAHTSFPVATLGAVPAYVILIGVIGVIMKYLRSSDRSACLEAEARRQSELRAQDLLTLQHVSAIVAGHLTMEDAITAIVHELSKAFGHSLISLYLMDDTQLKLQAQVGYTTYYEALDPGQGVIGAAYVQDETIFIRDTRIDTAYLQAQEGVVSEIAVPIRHETAPVGVLNVESQDALTDRDRDLMELFGSQVSVVLRNARLAGELRVRAEQDPLTGVLNRRALVDSLQQSLQAREKTCSVLVIDLNNFKQVNDTYGHLAGDELLKHVAEILAESCRAQDYCGRAGGDEFVVVLPGADRAQALGVLNRIKVVLGERPYRSAEHHCIPLSLSIGLASTPVDGTTWQELLAGADQVMYQEKRASAVGSYSLSW